MQLITKIDKPYTEEQKVEFIIEYNRNNNYEIRETEDSLEAWGYTEEEREQQRREEISKLSLTKREVFLALYKDKGITPEQIKAGLTNPEALIEFEYATEYFRGNPLIDVIGQSLGYSSAQLDYLFINGSLP